MTVKFYSVADFYHSHSRLFIVSHDLAISGSIEYISQDCIYSVAE